MARGITRFLDTREEGNEVDLDISLNPSDIANMKYAPLISCNIECTFTCYKNIYRDNRKNGDYVKK